MASVYTEFNTFLNCLPRLPHKDLGSVIDTLFLVRELEYWQFADERPNDDKALETIRNINALCDKYSVKIHEKLVGDKVPWDEIDWNAYHWYLVRNLWPRVKNEESVRCVSKRYSVSTSN